VTVGMALSVPRACFTNNLGITWSCPFPTTGALQKMKEDVVVVVERQWMKDSTIEVGRRTKINKKKNNISQ